MSDDLKEIKKLLLAALAMLELQEEIARLTNPGVCNCDKHCES